MILYSFISCRRPSQLQITAVRKNTISIKRPAEHTASAKWNLFLTKVQIPKAKMQQLIKHLRANSDLFSLLSEPNQLK